MRDSLETVGILTLCGYYFTLLHMRDEMVEEVHMRWHR